KRLKEILKEIPPNYDLVYFGCSGSCDQEFDWINNLYYGKNKTVYYNNKKLKNLIRPTKPFYTHAYLISNKGAKKFINNKNLKKIIYHIDYSLCKYIYEDKKNNFNMLAIIPTLIDQKNDALSSDIVGKEHPLINKLFHNIKLSNLLSLDYFLNLQTLYIRKFDI